MIAIIERAKNYSDRKAIYSFGKYFTYDELVNSATYFAKRLTEKKNDLLEERVAFLMKPGFNYVMIQWAIWQAGGVAVPLDNHAPIELLQYIIQDTKPLILVIDKDHEGMISALQAYHPCSIVIIDAEQAYYSNQIFEENNIEQSRMALISYNPDHTNSPKGVVMTHANIFVQISTLVKSWEWKKNDYSLCILPISQNERILEFMCCSLWVGACFEFVLKLNETNIFKIFGEGKVTLTMADSIIYSKLIRFWNEIPYKERLLIQEKMERQRVMVNSSTSMSVFELHKWEKICGHILIECYGKAEAGMIFSNPLKGNRIPGYVGKPLTKVQVRIADENDQLLRIGSPGEIQIKGPSVFKKYWNKVQETKDAFTKDGWFRTRDIGIIENDSFKILERDNAIINSLEGK